MKKRITALFLLVCMLLTLMPVGTLADEDEGDQTPTPAVEPAQPQNGGGSGTGGTGGGTGNTGGSAGGTGSTGRTSTGESGSAGSGTGGTGGETHTHTWSDLKDLGNGKHGRTCTGCNETKDVSDHNWTAWSMSTDISWLGEVRTCQDCNAKETQDHDWGDWQESSSLHWRQCKSCGASGQDAHIYEYTSKGDGTHTGKCKLCGQTLEPEACKQAAQPRHVTGTETHEYYCELCNKTLDTEACTKTEATCAEPAKCTKCGETYGEASATHTGKSIYKANTDGTTHSLACETCGNPLSDVKAPHKEAAKPRTVAGTKTHEYYCEVCQAATRNAEDCTPKCVSNEDGTHNVVCAKCGQTLEENVKCTPKNINAKCGSSVRCKACQGSYRLPHDPDANGVCKRFSTDSKKNKCSCTAEKHQKQWTAEKAEQGDTYICDDCGSTVQKKEIDVSINISGYKEDNKPSNLSASSSNANVKPGKPIGVTPNDAKFQKGKKYAVTVPFEVEPGYKVKSLKISGVTVTPMQLDDGSWGATAELPAVEEMVTLTFKTNGGRSIDPINVTKGTKITKDELKNKYTPTRSGYWFCGWYEENTFKNKVGNLTLNEDTTIYAKWQKEDTTNPKTGDTIGLAAGVLAVTAILGAAVVTKKKRTW